MNLAGLDLNLLLVFDAVMRTRNVTRAGFEIGMSQPAVSKALGRLRYHLKDNLFIRSSEGMRATPRALELAGPIRNALMELETALDPTEFDPASSTRTFSIVANDYVTGVLMPTIMDLFIERAPRTNWRFRPTTGRSLEMLDGQEADFAMTPLPVLELPERFGSFEIMSESFAVIMRRGHELTTGELTLERYVSAPHLLVTIRGDDRGFIDDALEAQGLARRVSMTINHFTVGPPIVAASNMIQTVPKRLAELYAPVHDLVVRESPLKGPEWLMRFYLIWNKKLATHPAHDWFRQTIRETVALTAGFSATTEASEIQSAS
ncbi:MAG: LysR family transcriptional regulator [Pseudomonadota bacterium]